MGSDEELDVWAELARARELDRHTGASEPDVRLLSEKLGLMQEALTLQHELLRRRFEERANAMPGHVGARATLNARVAIPHPHVLLSMRSELFPPLVGESIRHLGATPRQLPVSVAAKGCDKKGSKNTDVGTASAHRCTTEGCTPLSMDRGTRAKDPFTGRMFVASGRVFVCSRTCVEHVCGDNCILTVCTPGNESYVCPVSGIVVSGLIDASRQTTYYNSQRHFEGGEMTTAEAGMTVDHGGSWSPGPAQRTPSVHGSSPAFSSPSPPFSSSRDTPGSKRRHGSLSASPSCTSTASWSLPVSPPPVATRSSSCSPLSGGRRTGRSWSPGSPGSERDPFPDRDSTSEDAPETRRIRRRTDTVASVLMRPLSSSCSAVATRSVSMGSISTDRGGRSQWSGEDTTFPHRSSPSETPVASHGAHALPPPTSQACVNRYYYRPRSSSGPGRVRYFNVAQNRTVWKQASTEDIPFNMDEVEPPPPPPKYGSADGAPRVVALARRDYAIRLCTVLSDEVMTRQACAECIGGAPARIRERLVELMTSRSLVPGESISEEEMEEARRDIPSEDAKRVLEEMESPPDRETMPTDPASDTAPRATKRYLSGRLELEALADLVLHCWDLLYDVPHVLANGVRFQDCAMALVYALRDGVTLVPSGPGCVTDGARAVTMIPPVPVRLVPEWLLDGPVCSSAVGYVVFGPSSQASPGTPVGRRGSVSLASSHAQAAHRRLSNKFSFQAPPPAPTPQFCDPRLSGDAAAIADVDGAASHPSIVASVNGITASSPTPRRRGHAGSHTELLTTVLRASKETLDRCYASFADTCMYPEELGQRAVRIEELGTPDFAPLRARDSGSNTPQSTRRTTILL